MHYTVSGACQIVLSCIALVKTSECVVLPHRIFALCALKSTEENAINPVQIFLGQQPVVVVHNPEAGR